MHLYSWNHKNVKDFSIKQFKINQVYNVITTTKIKKSRKIQQQQKPVFYFDLNLQKKGNKYYVWGDILHN